MPGSAADLRAMLNGLRKGLVTRRQLAVNATRIVRMAQKLAGGKTE